MTVRTYQTYCILVETFAKFKLKLETYFLPLMNIDYNRRSITKKLIVFIELEFAVPRKLIKFKLYQNTWEK